MLIYSENFMVSLETWKLTRYQFQKIKGWSHHNENFETKIWFQQIKKYTDNMWEKKEEIYLILIEPNWRNWWLYA